MMRSLSWDWFCSHLWNNKLLVCKHVRVVESLPISGYLSDGCLVVAKQNHVHLDKIEKVCNAYYYLFTK